MSRSLRRGALAATAIVFSIASLAACGAGNDAQSLQIRPDNAEAAVDDIKIQNAAVVTQPEPGAEGPAVVTATLFNNGARAETLESIKLPGASGEVKLKPAKGTGPVSVPAGGSLVLGGEGNASAVIENGREAAEDGGVQPVVFELSETGAVELQALVFPATHYFKDFGPSELPKPPVTTASPTGTPTGSPDETAAAPRAPRPRPRRRRTGPPGEAAEDDAEDSAEEHGAEH